MGSENNAPARTETPPPASTTASTGTSTSAGAPASPPPDEREAAAASESGRRVWSGELLLRGSETESRIACVAEQYHLPPKARVQDTACWPTLLTCDGAHNLKNIAQFHELMLRADAQWCVRFVPVDDRGLERLDSVLVQLATVLAQRKLVFVVDCGVADGALVGSLFIWGMLTRSYGYCLLGVFCPPV